MALIAVALGAGSVALGVCGPFTDVSDAAFCPFVLEIFTLAITTGTSPTTYDPAANVSRLQMAAFLSRTVDRVLQRGSRRAALRQFWSTQSAQIPLTTTLGGLPQMIEFDGADLWVGLGLTGQVTRVRASDGMLLETWTGVADFAAGVLIAMGKVLVVGRGNAPGLSGRLYRIDPSLPAGAATTVASGLPQFAFSIAYDGGRIWTGNNDDSVSIVTPGATLPWTVTTVGGFQSVRGILYDGANIWITNTLENRADGPIQIGNLVKLNSVGAALQTVTIGAGPSFPLFDGSNIWVPNVGDSSVSVVRASNGAVLATLTGNGLAVPFQPAFDGQRVLVTNFSGDSVSVWKAADLTPLGSFPMPANSLPYAACSDGVSFWVSLFNGRKLARF
jgi:hypothetical protein